MAKLLLLGAILSSLVPAVAIAQAGAPPQRQDARNTALIRSGHLTSTGETVPNPGISQGNGTTALDLQIQEEDRRIEGSICRGC